MNISSTNKSSGLVATAKPLGKSALHQEKNTLCASIQKVGNVLTDVKREIKATTNHLNKNNSLLTSLKGIASKHGDDANIRLKNDHFKLGQGSNFLKNLINGGRYKLEQQVAATKLAVKGNEVSARTGISTLTQKIETIKESLVSSTSKLEKNQTEYTSLKTKLKGVDQQIDTINEAEAKTKKIDQKKIKLCQDFSIIYQSNAGCKAINAEARHQFGNGIQPKRLSGNKVIAEYEKAHGIDIFFKGNAPIKSTIKYYCSALPDLTKNIAKAWYTPTGTTTTSHRGQGMTKDGIDKLITQFLDDRAGSVYKLGQFFSTSKNVDVARSFANKTTDSIKVMFEVKGNSGRGLSVTGGLSFKNNESEVLYSPLANFAVTTMTGDDSKGYTIKLNEVKQDTAAKVLPY